MDTRESEPADEPTPSTVAEVCPREWDVESGDGSQPLSAKALRELAQQARAAGELQCALALLERAHAIDPLYHRLAFDIGELAFELDDCDKARVYLVHFTKYGDLDTSATQLDHAWEMLETIAARQCAHVRPEPELMPTVCLEVPIEAPEQDVGSKKSRCTKPRDRNSNRG